MFSNDGYRVYFADFTKRHFVKDFEKKYKGAWLTTRKALVSEFRNVDMLIDSGRTEPPIHFTDDRSELIIKHKFAIAGTNKSRLASGCEIIAHVNEADKIVTVLLVYHKDHFGKSGETAEWERIIKTEYKYLLTKFGL
jgi:hypothetical protein